MGGSCGWSSGQLGGTLPAVTLDDLAGLWVEVGVSREIGEAVVQ